MTIKKIVINLKATAKKGKTHIKDRKSIKDSKSFKINVKENLLIIFVVFVSLVIRKVEDKHSVTRQSQTTANN